MVACTIPLDEPATGLARPLAEGSVAIVARLQQEAAVTVPPTEQNTNGALRYAHDGYILDNRRVVRHGAASAGRDHANVKEFYLGLSSAGRRSFRDIESCERRERRL